MYVHGLLLLSACTPHGECRMRWLIQWFRVAAVSVRALELQVRHAYSKWRGILFGIEDSLKLLPVQCTIKLQVEVCQQHEACLPWMDLCSLSSDKHHRYQKTHEKVG